MADSTIANLTDGATADATDRIPIERSPFGAGTNRYITPAYIKTFVGASSGAALSGITAAAGANTIASGNNHSQIWNWALTSNSVSAMTFGETTAATGGTSTSGIPNQVIGKFSTLAASTASPLSVYSRGTHVFSVSPSTAQILSASGSRANPVYGFAAATGSGMLLNGSTLEWAIGGTLAFDVNGTQVRGPKGAAATPTYTENISWANSGLFFPASGVLGFSAGSAERGRISGANFVWGTAALATTATNGFIYTPTCAGTPTGVPTAFTGTVPMIFDTTGVKLWIYTGGAWKGVVVA